MTNEWTMTEFNDSFFYAVSANDYDDGEDHTEEAPPIDATLLHADEEVAERVFALRLHLNDFNGIISQSSWDDKLFDVNPHVVWVGMSPEKARARVKLLREALAKIQGEYAGLQNVSLATLRENSYDKVIRNLREYAPEEMNAGIHDVANTLYFLIDLLAREDHSKTLIEVWEGLEVVDRTEPRETQDTSWKVYTDDEANEAWEEALDSYLEDCVLPEVPENARRYFDKEAWKRDAREDGRAHAISRYDGNEHTVETGGTLNQFVIVREN